MTHDDDARRAIMDYDPDDTLPPPLLRRGRPVVIRTHCKLGHELTPENTYEYKNGPNRAPSRYCKTCSREQAREWIRKNPERAKELNRKSNSTKLWTRDRAEHNRWWRFRKKYGLTKEQYDALWEAQAGLCGICGLQLRQRMTYTETGPRTSKDTAAIDHCHATGKVRGFLCQCCNRAIGLMYDDPVKLEAGAAYIRKTQS